MQLQDLLFMMSPIGLYITMQEWRSLVDTANGNKVKILGRIIFLNAPLIALIILGIKGEPTLRQEATMAKGDPTMKAEFWFGGRKNKKLVEIKYKQSKQDDLVSDFISFMESRGYSFKKMWPERDADFIDDKGRKFWVEEGLVQINNSANEIREFFVRTDEKALKGKKNK